jgi:hypothetical protein
VRQHSGHGGHLASHLRETFLEAADAFVRWDGRGAEPTVLLDDEFGSRQITLSAACGLVWNCTDILPGSEYAHLKDCLEKRLIGGSYGAAAHAIHSWLGDRIAA